MQSAVASGYGRVLTSAGFFWRCWTCAYAGGLAAFVAYVAARRDVRRAARSVGGAVAVSAVLLALQVSFFP